MSESNTGTSPQKIPINSYVELMGLFKNQKDRDLIEWLAENLARIGDFHGVPHDYDIYLPKIFDYMRRFANEHPDFKEIIEHYEPDPAKVEEWLSTLEKSGMYPKWDRYRYQKPETKSNPSPAPATTTVPKSTKPATTSIKYDPSLDFEMITDHCARISEFVVCQGDVVEIYYKNTWRTGVITSINQFQFWVRMPDTTIVNRKFSKHSYTIVARGKYYHQEVEPYLGE